MVDGAELRCMNGETHARRRARARGAQAATRKCPNCVGSGRLLPHLRAGSLPMNRLTVARWRRRDRGYLTGTHTRKSCVGAGRLLPQLRALELPVDRGAGGRASRHRTAIGRSLCALAVWVRPPMWVPDVFSRSYARARTGDCLGDTRGWLPESSAEHCICAKPSRDWPQAAIPSGSASGRPRKRGPPAAAANASRSVCQNPSTCML